MRLNDARILWARSGNRCAFPGRNIEMAPDGLKTSLGEIAHIVATSVDGPRGASPLPPDRRDDYDNLIFISSTFSWSVRSFLGSEEDCS